MIRMFSNNIRIILASSSPRRQELLQSVGLPFTTMPSNFDESSVTANHPASLVELLSFHKAQSVYEKLLKDCGSEEGLIVIGSDTVVVLNSEVLGKPSSPSHAEEMLGRLQGRTHTVYTGLCILGHQHTPSGEHTPVRRIVHEKTDVTMAPLCGDTIRRYVATKEPLDKAGSYAIQGLGATLVSRIQGDYFTVVGLPLHRLSMLLAEIQVTLF